MKHLNAILCLVMATFLIGCGEGYETINLATGPTTDQEFDLLIAGDITDETGTIFSASDTTYNYRLVENRKAAGGLPDTYYDLAGTVILNTTKKKITARLGQRINGQYGNGGQLVASQGVDFYLDANANLSQLRAPTGCKLNHFTRSTSPYGQKVLRCRYDYQTRVGPMKFATITEFGQTKRIQGYMELALQKELYESIRYMTVFDGWGRTNPLFTKIDKNRLTGGSQPVVLDDTPTPQPTQTNTVRDECNLSLDGMANYWARSTSPWSSYVENYLKQNRYSGQNLQRKCETDSTYRANIKRYQAYN